MHDFSDLTARAAFVLFQYLTLPYFTLQACPCIRLDKVIIVTVAPKFVGLQVPFIPCAHRCEYGTSCMHEYMDLQIFELTFAS